MTIDISFAGSMLPPVPRPPAARPVQVPWHVQFGAGDVRVLSDQQLQDAYRLTMINDYTHVWRDGMGEWQVLGSLLGTLSADAVRRAYGASTPSVSPAQYAAAHYAALQQAEADYAAEQYAAEAAAAEQYAAQQAQADYAAEQAARANVRYGYARSAQPDYAAHDFNAGLAPVPASVQPLTLAASPETTTFGRRKRARFGTWLLSAAFVLGTGITVYRNDLFFPAIRAAGYETKYLALEHGSVGAPGFGTPRSAALLIDDGLSSVGGADREARPSSPLPAPAAPGVSPVARSAVSSSATPAASPMASPAASPSVASGAVQPPKADANQVRSIDELPVAAGPVVPAPAAAAPHPVNRAPLAAVQPLSSPAPVKAAAVTRPAAKPAAPAPAPAPAEAAKPKAAVAKAPPAPPPVPAGPRTDKQKLLDAIGGAIANQ